MWLLNLYVTHLSKLFTMLTNVSSFFALIMQGTDTPSTSSAVGTIPAWVISSCYSCLCWDYISELFQTSAVLCVMLPQPIEEISYMLLLNGASVDAMTNADFDSHLPLKFSGMMLCWTQLLLFLAWAHEAVATGASPTYSFVSYFAIEALLLNILRLVPGVVMNLFGTVLKTIVHRKGALLLALS